MELKPGDFLEHTWNDHLKPIRVVTVRKKWVRVTHRGVITGGINIERKPYFKLRRDTVDLEYIVVRQNGLRKAQRMARSLQDPPSF